MRQDADESTPKLAFPPSISHSAGDLAGMVDLARRLGIARKAVEDLPADVEGVARSEWSNGWQEEIVACASGMPDAIDGVEAAREVLAFAELCVSTRRHDLGFAFALNMADLVAAARSASAFVERYREEERSLSAGYSPEIARRIEVEGTSAAWIRPPASFGS